MSFSARGPAADLSEARVRLQETLIACGESVIAVSGGVDSLTLAAFAHTVPGARITAVHAVSPAVPMQATERVKTFAAERGLALVLLDAGEFTDEAYRLNPANRCYFCKSHLYDGIRARFDATVLSGANLDDLDDYRPGLIAARERRVRHPFVEAGFTKARVRELARDLGLGDIAELPSAPCLSSRVETGIRIEAAALALVDAVETELRAALRPETVRCRVRRAGVVVEMDEGALDRLAAADRAAWIASIALRARAAGVAGDVRFEAYRRGSAFLLPPRVSDFDLDLLRAERVGLDEALFCAGKTPEQIAAIARTVVAAGRSMLLTRLDEARHAALPDDVRARIDYEPLSRTAILGALREKSEVVRVAIVSAGTSDLAVSREAKRTIEYYGEAAAEFNDVGVAGIHRLFSRLDAIRRCEIVIAVAGMDAALVSVLGGLVKAPVIAVPTSVGYGAARGGETALAASLASCASGVVVVNIDNGYGAACAALRMLGRNRLA